MSALPVFFSAASRLGAIPLLGHEPPETVLVDVQALLGRHLQGQVDREAVGVVQLERLGAGQRVRAAAPVSSTEASKIAVPVRRVLANAASSPSMTVRMLAATLLSSGYSPLIASSATEVSSCMKRSPVVGTPSSRTRRGPMRRRHAAQHVAAALVARQDAVPDQHHRERAWSAIDPQRHVGAWSRAVALPVSSAARSRIGQVVSVS